MKKRNIFADIESLEYGETNFFFLIILPFKCYYSEQTITRKFSIHITIELNCGMVLFREGSSSIIWKNEESFFLF